MRFDLFRFSPMLVKSSGARAAFVAAGLCAGLVAGCGGSDIGSGAPQSQSVSTTIASRYRVTDIAPYVNYVVDEYPRFSADGRVVLHTSQNQWAVWQNGTLTNLPSGFAASGVNSSGVVVGQDSTRHAAVYQDGVVTSLPGAPEESRAIGINDAGVIVGNLSLGQAFEYRNRQVTLLPSPSESFATVTQVTSDGKAFAYAGANDGSNRRALVWNNGSPVVLSQFTGLGINRRGEIAGYESGGSGLIGVVGSGEQTRAVSTENSTTWDIGDQGVAVGTLYGDIFHGKIDRRPFAWYDGQLVSLRDRIVLNAGETTGILEDAKAIRSDGAVLVIGRRGSEIQNRYYLLTPER